MSVTSGFFNSLNGDRKYNAEQMSAIFDGIIIDGIYASIGTAFSVNADSENRISIGIGRGWFNNTWIYNDSILIMTMDEAELLLDRIDAVVIDIDHSDSVREGTIKIVKGVASSNPARPIMIKENFHNQYPLAFIKRTAGSTSVRQADITSMIGSEDTPFVTGILQTVSLDELLGKWQDELDRWMLNEETDYDIWFEQMKTDLASEQALLDQWIASEQNDFVNWFNSMKDQLSTDAAAHLLNKIDKEEINRILISGFVDGHKEFSTDGTTIITQSGDGRVLEKVFTDGFSVCTTTLKYSNGTIIASATKRFDSTGTVIDTSVSYY